MCLSRSNINILYALLFLFKTSLSFSQQSILLNQSAYNLYVLSPAAIGLNKDVNANCHYKKNWLGLSESPEIIQFTIDGSVSNNKYGLGLNVLNEKAGIFSKTYLSGAFNYKVKLTKLNCFYFGLSAGFQKQQSDFSKIKADAPDEFAQWPQQQSVTIPDAAFGIVYNYKKLYITATASQILQQNYSYKEPVFNKEFTYKTVSQFIFSVQNTFVLKAERWSYKPQVTIRTPQGLPFQVDLVNTFVYNNKLLIGIGYRNHYATYANLGYFINEKLRIIYSYEYSLGIQSIVKGGHEIGISFGLMNGSGKKINSNETLSENKLQDIYEKLDQHEQQMEALTKRLDSLDKNIIRLHSEIDLLKNQQVNQIEIKNAVENYFTNNLIENNNKEQKSKNTSEHSNTINTAGKYKVISPKTENDYKTLSDSSKANYKIVLGVYQLLKYAKEYQKFLNREIGLETVLVQLEDHPKKFIYVCAPKEFSNLKDALDKLKTIRNKTHSTSMEITRGDAWILQTLIK